MTIVTIFKYPWVCSCQGLKEKNSQSQSSSDLLLFLSCIYITQNSFIP